MCVCVYVCTSVCDRQVMSNQCVLDIFKNLKVHPPNT